jgi:hypothetical protein
MAWGVVMPMAEKPKSKAVLRRDWVNACTGQPWVWACIWRFAGPAVKRGFGRSIFCRKASGWIANGLNRTQIKEEAEKMCCTVGHLWGA